jgi:uncharacterized protein
MPAAISQPDSSICNPGEDVVILFARTPVPGGVKSRLQPPWTPDQACRFHIAATLDTAKLLDATLPNSTAVTRWIFWSESPPPDSSGIGLPASFRAAIQQGADLGERMAEAFARAFVSGARRAVIVGSDSPHLPASRIPQAFDELAHHDCVLGPSDDGGYYLIGCRRFDPQLFRGVEWGSRKAFEQTRTNAALLNFSVGNLDSWYDLDEWKDIERLTYEGRRGVDLPPHVAAFLKELEKEKGEHH